jgi:hypothetical protein
LLCRHTGTVQRHRHAPEESPLVVAEELTTIRHESNAGLNAARRIAVEDGMHPGAHEIDPILPTSRQRLRLLGNCLRSDPALGAGEGVTFPYERHAAQIADRSRAAMRGHRLADHLGRALLGGEGGSLRVPARQQCGQQKERCKDGSSGTDIPHRSLRG